MADVGVEPAFWAGRRVLVTGHSGFKGSWLALWLAELGAGVTGFSMPDGDIRDADAVANAVRAARPEVVLHLAAQPIVRRSYVDPAETYAINVMGTVNLLDAVRAAGTAQAIVVVTSDKCYLNTGLEHAYREDDPLGGHDPYSSSKAAQELVAAAYRQSFELPLATARAGNVIGGGDFGQDRLIPDAMRAALDGRALEVRNPHAVRPWQHVLNPLAGYLTLAQRLASDRPPTGRAFNFGPPREDARPVGEVVARLAELWPEQLDYVDASEPDAPHEAGFLHIDSSRARDVLGWEPRWRLDDALRAVVEWYSAHGRGEDTRAVMLDQIDAFSRAA